MVRSYSAVLFVVLLVNILPPVEMAANSIEREATVELLPNDLIGESNRQQEEETIANPVQVIENHVSKTWQTIVRQILEEVRAGMKYKRTLVSYPSSTEQTLRLFLLLLPLIKAGIVPSSPLGPVPHLPLQTVPAMGTPAVPSYLPAPPALAPPNLVDVPSVPVGPSDVLPHPQVPGVPPIGPQMVMNGVPSNPITHGVLDGSSGLPLGSQDMLPDMANLPGTSGVQDVVPGSVGSNVLPTDDTDLLGVVPGVDKNPVSNGVLPSSGTGLQGAPMVPVEIPEVPQVSTHDQALPSVPVVPSVPVAAPGLPNNLAPPRLGSLY